MKRKIVSGTAACIAVLFVLALVSGCPNPAGGDDNPAGSGGKPAAVTLESIEVTQGPGKADYLLDEELDLTGLVVTGVYSDGTAKALSTGPENISGYEKSSAGEQTLTVTVGGKTALRHESS
jgi:hypothetical protein